MANDVLLTCEGLAKAYGAEPLFEGLSFTLFGGDHAGLVGPNGAGKSTLMKILAGLETSDSGTLAVRKGVRVGYVPQDPSFPAGLTAEEALLHSLDDTEGLEEYERFHRVAVALAKAGFEDRQVSVDILSGGWRKRLSIARELAREPDVLLLDEPTNHLDVESTLWLEELLQGESEAFVVVSHDRYFLDNVCRRMLEIDRVYPEGILAVDGSYADFLERRDELLQHQKRYQETLANLVRREVEWLRRGPKARTSKSSSRIQQAEGLIDALAESKSRLGSAGDGRGRSAGIDFDASERRSKRLWECKGLSKSLGTEETGILRIVRDLDLLLSPGHRLGILGPNGSGKTTLLRLIVAELEPDAGSVRTAPGLRVAYFEQNRESLDPDLTLRRALAPRGDSLIYRDRVIHVASWARRFLFQPEQLDMPVSGLSGGERARIVLSRLMLQPADLLVLDEPTNDLDIPTLDVLEEALLEFPGAIVLVTHDRYLLDRISTRILALEGDGRTQFYADVAQWQDHREERRTAERRARQRQARDQAEKSKPAAPKRKRLSYKDKLEFESMEERVLEAEERAAAAQAATEDPAVATDAAALHERFQELATAQQEVERLYARWAELEEMAG
ncbi:MAG: ABC-F family ATP-binding cassette domain-containing protein [Thermoanaerobaculia bacterium]|nr:ABC-F family ATP-binding cassette domain-containing protein [Thermoanaerobaculia bacterium]